MSELGVGRGQVPSYTALEGEVRDSRATAASVNSGATDMI